ncbi:MAG: hypothetical protein JWQ02_2857 [Capsulimonas sp.]|nr:hypothetical protein [Capsulimonas sp.]
MRGLLTAQKLDAASMMHPSRLNSGRDSAHDALELARLRSQADAHPNGRADRQGADGNKRQTAQAHAVDLNDPHSHVLIGGRR